jgi:diaminohydroxyphosphoribosylaminopyrimidine deaminase/5-amino-6-(5-phosphoribosylamino)uracil reductase
MRDPNPAVSGRGLRELRAAGIAAELAPSFQAESRRLNEPFATWITAHRPLVTLKTAMTLDGHVVLPAAPNGKQNRWITSDISRAEVHRMRHACDAILTGIGTVTADDPLLTDRSGLPRRRPLLRVVVDSRLRLGLRSRLVRTANHDVVVFTCAGDTSPRARALRHAGLEVVTIPSKRSAGLEHRSSRYCRRPSAHARVDLRQVLAELARRDILSVLLEAGPTLNQTALDLGLVDKVRLFYAPMLVGRHAGSGEKRAPAELIAAGRLHKLSSVSIQQFGPDFAIEGYLRQIYRR